MSHDWIYERCQDCDHNTEDGECDKGTDPIDCAFEGLADEADARHDAARDGAA